MSDCCIIKDSDCCCVGLFTCCCKSDAAAGCCMCFGITMLVLFALPLSFLVLALLILAGALFIASFGCFCYFCCFCCCDEERMEGCGNIFKALGARCLLCCCCCFLTDGGHSDLMSAGAVDV